MAYYHPRTAAEADPTIEYARILETTSREVRRIVSTDADAPIIPEGVATLHDLLFKVLLNPNIPVRQILSFRSPDTDRDLAQQMFEGIWKITFGLGLVPGYEGVNLYKGKVENTLVLVKRSAILKYLAASSIKTSSKDGVSDITLSFHKEEEEGECTVSEVAKAASPKKTFLFCSSKFFGSDKKKNVNSYDIAGIISAANFRGYTDDKFRIVLLVKDKETVKGKFATAYRRYLTYIVQKETGREGILGRDDLEAAIVRLRERVAGRPDPEAFIQESMLGGTESKPFLSLRFHQELIVRKTLQIHAAGDTRSVLWGVVARGGKTYMCGGLIRDMAPKAKYVFIVAGAYSETHSQFLDKLLDVRAQGFQDFDDYTTVNVRDEAFTFDATKKYIFFISAELLKAFVERKSGKAKAKKRTVMTLVQDGTIVPELVFFDEIHKGGTTSLADDAMSLIAGTAFKVFMTATYNKLFIKDEYGITNENFVTWGYEDIQLAKGMESPEVVETFGRKYGKELCDSVIASQSARGTSLTDIAHQYQQFPEIQFLTTTFSDAFRESMQKQNILDPTAGFRMSTLLATGGGCKDIEMKKRYTCLINPASAAVLLNYIAPHTSQMKTIGGTAVVQTALARENVMTRIGRTSQRRGDILSNIHTEFRAHSQLWFLPQPTSGVDDTPLMSIMTSLASLLMQHPWFSKHFCVVAVSSGFKGTDTTSYEGGGSITTTNGGEDTRKTIHALERNAFEMDPPRGLIILAGKMLTLGVSLPCVNVVALLDDSHSSDLTYQKMFRALTESEGKKIGYIIDVNPTRTLKTLYDYTKVEHDASDVMSDTVDATVLTNLYLIDEDQLFVMDTDRERVTPERLNGEIEAYLNSGRKTYRSIVDEAAAKIGSIEFKEELAALRNDLRAVSPEALQVASRLADVPSGIEVIKEAAPKKKKTPQPTAEDDNDTKEKMQALREMILTTMTLLAFLTNFSTFAEALAYYSADTDNIQDIIHSVLVDRGLTTSEAKTKVTQTLILAITKVQMQLTQPFGKMRAKLSELTGDQKEVVEFIQQNLRPKKEQVAARGEVFTPLTLVEDMLNHLPDTVWTNPDLKWLDPSNGIGNFPVIAFTKLDTALKTVPGYEDDAVRRKHIVEKMLYMVELDDANIRLSKKLLEKMCGNPDCRFNLLKQDFLVGDMRAAFGVTGFDVAMANPPYNPPKTDTGPSGNLIWPNFVMKMESLLNDGGYIVAVHPPGWKKPTEDVYKPEKFREGSFKGQIRQGQVWQYLKSRGAFHYIYTNDQRSKTLEFLPSFPSVDYYVFQKGGPATRLSTRNIFYGNEYVSSDIQLNTTLPYLPCLVTKETIDIIANVIRKEGSKPSFKAGFDPRGFKSKEKGEIKYMYDASAKGPNYAFYEERNENVDTSKVVINFNGGIAGYYCKYIDSSDQIGVLHHTMYVKVESIEQGKSIESFFNSDVARFVFLITQYASGMRTQNEPLVANSITLPPIGTTDYYAFFGIEEYQPFIEKILADYEASKAPKRKAAVAATPRKKSPKSTLRNKPPV